jgi:hypothetical protein
LKKSVFVTVLLAALLVMPMGTAFAQNATDQTWTSSITYYTPSATSGTMTVMYYAEGTGASYPAGDLPLDPHKAGSLFIGSVTAVPDGFAGSAVLSADVAIVATYVQFVAGQAGAYGRTLYTGFDASQAAATFFIPTLLYQRFNSTTMIGVQNIEDTTITAVIKAYAVGEVIPTGVTTHTIPAQASAVLSASELGVPSGFTGSAVVEATGRVVASAQETGDNNRSAYAFEGTAQGSNTVYMASMLCNAFNGQISYYAIQNASTTASGDVSIAFYDTAGASAGSMAAVTVPAGGKISVNPCNEGVADNMSGSAVITSVGAPIIAIGKVKAPNGLATSFVGQSAGALAVSAPYIRWAASPESEFRAYIAVMNVGSSPATNVVATYYDLDDTSGARTAGTVNLATTSAPLNQYIKVNTNPSTAGVLETADNSFGFTPTGGAVEITSDQPIVVVVRLTRQVSPALDGMTLLGEDYNAVAQ